MTGISEQAVTAAKQVLAKCAATDPWFPHGGEALVLAWAEQFMIANIAVADLLAGVTAVYQAHGAGFKPLPADVICAARSIRNDRVARETREQREDREDVIDRKITDHVAEIAAARSLPANDDPQRPVPNPARVRCPWCHAGPGSPCVIPDTRIALRKAPYHPARREALQAVSAGDTR